MTKYQVRLVERPEGWKQESWDDVPPSPGKLLDVVGEADHLFPAVRLAIEFNEGQPDQSGNRWAIGVEPGCLGQTWQGARLSTPLVYKVAAIWWPAGWEPNSPLDVPNCVWRSQAETDREPLSYKRALAKVRALNRQSIDTPGPMWYVLLAVENEPVSRTVSYDPSGCETTVSVRRLHVVRHEDDHRSGDCSHCPAHAKDCAKESWETLEQIGSQSETRSAAVEE